MARDEEIKNKIKDHFNRKDLLISKNNLCSAIRRLIINTIMHEFTDGLKSANFDGNLFDYLNNKYLWDSKIYLDKKFRDEIIQFKKYGIKVKEAYTLYHYLGEEDGVKFKKEIDNFVDEINKEKKSQKQKVETKTSTENITQDKKEDVTPIKNEQVANDFDDNEEEQLKEEEIEEDY